MRIAVFFMTTALVVLACASERPSDDDDGSTTSGAGAASVSVCNSIGTTSAGVGSGVAGGSVECESQWDCDDGYSYGVRCSGASGSWSCECLHNGPAVSTFQSATFCELNNDQARIDEANAQCDFSIQ